MSDFNSGFSSSSFDSLSSSDSFSSFSSVGFSSSGFDTFSSSSNTLFDNGHSFSSAFRGYDPLSSSCDAQRWESEDDDDFLNLLDPLNPLSPIYIGGSKTKTHTAQFDAAKQARPGRITFAVPVYLICGRPDEETWNLIDFCSSLKIIKRR